MRILFLSARFCYPMLKGDASRVYHQLGELSRDHQITLLSGTEGPVTDDNYTKVATLCDQVILVPIRRPTIAWNLASGLFSSLPLQVSYYRSPAIRRQLDRLLAHDKFDVVHVSLVRMLPYVWHHSKPPVVVDLIDSLSLNLESRRHGRGLKRLAYELEYRRMLAYERAAVERYPALLVTSQADAAALGGGAKVRVMPMGVDLCRFGFHGPEERDPTTLIFTGNMGYEPNEQAVLWFAAEVWPLVKAAHPEARWRIVGTNPGERVRNLVRTHAGIEVAGWVPDIGEHLGKATLAVCPLRTGSGIQMKVQEAMATGTPVVATSTANRGVGGTHARDLLVADTATGLAAAISMLLHDADARARLGLAGRAFVEQHFSWERHARELEAIYDSVRPVG